MVTIVINAPLHSGRVAAGVGHDGRVTPVRSGLVVVDAHAGVVAAGSGAADYCGSYVWPGGYGLEDGAFGAGI